jgi:uncharacterized protein (DUF983 family)
MGRASEQEEGMSNVIITRDGDGVQFDPFLKCEDCGEHLCTAEEGDSFAVLAGVVEEHNCEAGGQAG